MLLVIRVSLRDALTVSRKRGHGLVEERAHRSISSVLREIGEQHEGSKGANLEAYSVSTRSFNFEASPTVVHLYELVGCSSSGGLFSAY